MRLLRIVGPWGLQFTGDLQDPVPPYAILSHTWGVEEQEVSYQDVLAGIGHTKAGWNKLRFLMDRARGDGLTHLWIDTCCINKQNYTELAKAINSMYKWYAKAARCYVYLSDVSTSSLRPWESMFHESRWFTRGWTLQELLAPRDLCFYSCEGHFLGTRTDKAELVHRITGIELEALHGRELSTFSTERRFQWALGRRTKEPEDEIYCLLGIFGIFMPLNYAEGRENALRRLRQEIADLAASRVPVHGDVQQLARRRGEILAALRFRAMDARRNTISRAVGTTCEWVLQQTQFVTWRNARQTSRAPRILWIKGHPGAGKSTIMKFIDYTIARTVQRSTDILVSFYFNSRGEELEKSIVGMYRSLIVQLLEADDALACIIDDLRFGDRPPPHPSFFQDMPVEALKELLVAITSQIRARRIFCIVDGIDETDEEDMLDVIGFFRSLASVGVQQQLRLHICFASRHFPTFNIVNSMQLVIDREPGHQADIQHYIRANLDIGDHAGADQIKRDIQTRANGIFMWVVLVVRILNREYRRGDITFVRRYLAELPPQLGLFFPDLSQDQEMSRQTFVLCLRWILFAARPLCLEEFYLAMFTSSNMASAAEPPLQPTEFELPAVEVMENFLLASSRGLAEHDNSERRRVQFIHASIPDFLLRQNGITRITGVEHKDFEAASHQILRSHCRRGLVWSSASAELLALPDEGARAEALEHFRARMRREYPFLLYAQSFVLYHAERAADKLCQKAFCRDFDTALWCNVRSLVDDRSVCRFDNPAYAQHLSFLLAAAGCPRLLKTTYDLNEDCPRLQDEAGKTALVWAVLEERHDAVRALLAIGADVNTKDEYGHTPLHHCCEFDEDMLRLLLKAGADCRAADEDYQRPLHAAAESDSATSVKLLLEAGSDVDAIDVDAKTALHIATEDGTLESVASLLDARAKADKLDADGNAPIHIAARSGSLTKLELLLVRGAAVDLPDSSGRTALHHAVNGCCAGAVSLLLKHGADAAMADAQNKTPLEVARSRQRRLEKRRITIQELHDIRDCIQVLRQAMHSSIPEGLS